MAHHTVAPGLLADLLAPILSHLDRCPKQAGHSSLTSGINKARSPRELLLTASFLLFGLFSINPKHGCVGTNPSKSAASEMFRPGLWLNNAYDSTYREKENNPHHIFKCKIRGQLNSVSYMICPNIIQIKI